MSMLAPKSARMHQVMAQEMARQGNIDGAIAHYREAVKLDPQLPGLRFELAEALNLSSSPADQDQVEKEYQRRAVRQPLRREGRVPARRDRSPRRRFARALAHYKRALELQPNDAEANLGMGQNTQPDAPAVGGGALPRNAPRNSNRSPRSRTTVSPSCTGPRDAAPTRKKSWRNSRGSKT